MLKFCANLHFMYAEFPFLDRFAAAAADGFRAVEMTYPYEFPAEDIRRLCDESGIEVVSFNAPVGVIIPGVRRGVAVIPGMEQEYRSQIKQGLDYAKALNSPRLLSLAGIVPGDLPHSLARLTFIENLKFAADACDKANVTLLIETNNLVEHPGYYLARLEQAADIIAAVGHPRLRLLFDTFHVGINEGQRDGQVIDNFKRHLALIDHVQIANVPDRHEPGEGDLDFDAIFAAIEKSGYRGWIGCEYFPLTDTRASVAWMTKLPLGLGSAGE
ncbi:MAG: TIM barrel protein [Pseudolabrys sp.]|nr:TIM barrel protein [Pseudolabrys sp.]